ncbi:MAG TPA: tyrosine--tRNA ligase [Candidatus Limnocylindrales bacterium]|nr:tyrosine--tRNA ligase [Candidatus Limnocylindrales bacterium]
MSDAPRKSAPHSLKSIDEQLAYLRKGAAEIIPENELRVKLEQSAKTGKPLRVYLGVDPTAPDIHLGHTVVLRKLKHFQDMGHTAIFLIGDFSAMIGDPTGQSETRPPLTREQVDANAKTYLAQVYKILDREKTEVRYNSEWLGKMSSYDVVRLCGHYRLARMLEREDFRSRLANNLPISVHELLYPLLTAYDAVALKSDVELGATEQKFNMLVHREIQREYGVSPQAVLTMPILVGLDGAKKMSKSLGNYVGISEAPAQMFGKLMSISDELMWSYYELLTDFAEPVIVRLKEEVRIGVLHPMDAKMQLARTIIDAFHGEAAARAARDEFQRVFRDRQAPEEVPKYSVPKRTWPYRLAWLLAESKLVDSRAEAQRLIMQGAVEIDGQRVDDVKHEVDLSKPGSSFLFRAGKKKFLRVIVE